MFTNEFFRIYFGTPDQEEIGHIYKSINGYVDLDSLNTVEDYSSQITVPPEYANTYVAANMVCHKIGKCVIISGMIASKDRTDNIPNGAYLVLPEEICNTVITNGTYQQFAAFSKSDGSHVLGGIYFLPSIRHILFHNDTGGSHANIRFFTVYTLK